MDNKWVEQDWNFGNVTYLIGTDLCIFSLEIDGMTQKIPHFFGAFGAITYLISASHNVSNFFILPQKTVGPGREPRN